MLALKELKLNLLNFSHGNNNPLGSPWLSQLNILQQSLTTLQSHHVEHYQWVGLRQAEKTEQDTIKNYQALLSSKFIPYLENNIIQILQEDLQQKPLFLYRDLKSYLMLTDPDKRQNTYITQWFQERWGQMYSENPEFQQQLITHLTYVLENNLIQFNTNHPLIARIRETLQQLPTSNVSMMLLEDEYQQPPHPLLSKEHMIAGLNLDQITVPALYNMSLMDEIYNQKIPAVVNRLAQSNWVLGDEITASLTAAQQTTAIH